MRAVRSVNPEGGGKPEGCAVDLRDRRLQDFGGTGLGHGF